MRSFRHLTPGYIIDRLAVSRFRYKRGEKLPLYATGAIQFIESYLRDTDRVFEFGAGYSTPWYAKRAGAVVSVEDAPEWHERIKPLLPRKAELVFVDTSSERYDAYIGKVREFDPFDVVIVDGKKRAECAAAALDWIKPCGLLVWDDCNSDAFFWIRKIVPPILQWRHVSFDDGKVHVTGIFIKPGVLPTSTCTGP